MPNFTIYGHDSDPIDNATGHFRTSVLGRGSGDLDKSLKVIRNDPKSDGLQLGIVSPKIEGIFQRLNVAKKDVLTHTDGTKMSFQHHK